MPFFNRSEFDFIGFSSLLFVRFIASLEISIPMAFLFKSFAATSVVPLPQKGSRIVSFLLLETSIILSKRSIGFWVG